ncbi:MAG: glycosyltransferase family 2 protein [Candidatus Odinarchaeia archaeon]
MIYAVIPAFNEKRHIRGVIEQTKQFVDDIIVVDDGSVDGTCEVALNAGARVVRHPRNLGKGAALRTGFVKAIKLGANIVVTLDGDGQHKPEEIPKLLRKMDIYNADIVVGSRFLGNEDKLKKMPIQRIISNVLTTRILNRMFGLRITDSQSGFRAFRSSALRKLAYVDNKFAAETEILIDAHKKGFKIRETEISVIYGEERSKIKPLQDTFRWIIRVIIRKLSSY